MLALSAVGGVGQVVAVGAAGGVAVAVRCYSNPETTKITNNTSVSIRVTRVGSTYQPYSYEPFRLNKALAPGQSITYQTGSRATSNALTHNYIYVDSGQDGVRVVTSAGTITKRC